VSVAAADRGDGRRAAPSGPAGSPEPSGPADPAAADPAPARAVAARGRAAAPSRLRPLWLLAGVGAVLLAVIAGLAFGPARLNPYGVLVAVLDDVAHLHLRSGLSPREEAIVTALRLPRVCLGLLVGSMLALAGGCYQGIFRNPLADPYLLGVAAGAGLGATAAITATHSFAATAAAGGSGVPSVVPVAAFVGALVAVALTYALGAGGHRTPARLVLAGVAVASFCTAVQTYLQQRHVEAIREVYSWLLGSLATSGWHDVLLLLPYAVVTAVVILLLRRELDVLSLGDEEASGLGLHPQRSRYLLVAAASLGTAAAVAVSGLIGFVGLVVPHVIRLVFGSSYRVVLPLSMLFGAAFLTLADVAARTLITPAEIPIGVVTAFVGAPFFLLVLRTSERV
jgi:iron complex transport system permease protein